MTEIYFAGFNGAGHSILVFLLKVSENNSHYYINSTGDCKIIGNRATVFNDFSVVNWYKNPLKSVARFPIILQIAVGERLPKSGFLWLRNLFHRQRNSWCFYWMWGKVSHNDGHYYSWKEQFTQRDWEIYFAEFNKAAQLLSIGVFIESEWNQQSLCKWECRGERFRMTEKSISQDSTKPLIQQLRDWCFYWMW